jgi:hypothetical protein
MGAGLFMDLGVDLLQGRAVGNRHPQHQRQAVEQAHLVTRAWAAPKAARASAVSRRSRAMLRPSTAASTERGSREAGLNSGSAAVARKGAMGGCGSGSGWGDGWGDDGRATGGVATTPPGTARGGGEPRSGSLIRRSARSSSRRPNQTRR